MKRFAMPRLDAVNLTSYFRARAIDRMRLQADRAASLQRGLDRDHTLRDRLRHADATASFWILHAR